MNRDKLLKHRTEKLKQTVLFAYEKAPAFRTRLGSLEPGDIQTLEDLEKIPVVRKEALVDLQAGTPPFGGLLAVEPEDLMRIYSSPGPIYDPQGRDEDHWRFAEPLKIAGFGLGDIVMNTFPIICLRRVLCWTTGCVALGQRWYLRVWAIRISRCR